MAQTIIVYLLIAATVAVVIYRLVRTVKGKGGCNCSSCPHSGKTQCHCHDAQVKLPDIHLDK